jgi:hypothetical protein
VLDEVPVAASVRFNVRFDDLVCDRAVGLHGPVAHTQGPAARFAGQP